LQPVSGYNWKAISGGVGTAVLAARPATLERVVLPGTFVGTLVLHDAAATDGTTSTSAIITVPIPASVLFQTIDLGIQCRKGLVYEATGTPLAVVCWT